MRDSSTPENQRKIGKTADGYAQNDAQGDGCPELARVVDRWPKLPAAVRRAILAMAELD